MIEPTQPLKRFHALNVNTFQETDPVETTNPVKPEGSVSEIITQVAVAGHALAQERVQTTLDQKYTQVKFTILVIERFAVGVMTVETVLEVLLPVIVSNVLQVIVAKLDKVPHVD